jgi:hypothetical protein
MKKFVTIARMSDCDFRIFVAFIARPPVRLSKRSLKTELTVLQPRARKNSNAEPSNAGLSLLICIVACIPMAADGRWRSSQRRERPALSASWSRNNRVDAAEIGRKLTHVDPDL